MFTGLIFFILGIGFFLFFIYGRRYMQSRKFTMQASVPTGELQVQLEKTADIAIKQLEEYIGQLEFLLEEADVKIALLDQKLQLIQDDSSVPVNHPIPMPRRVDVELGPEVPPLKLVSVKNYSGSDQVVNDQREPINNERRKLIVSMSEQGYSVTEISKNTGVGKGEILLLLHLNRK
jgi:hypothetical protein